MKGSLIRAGEIVALFAILWLIGFRNLRATDGKREIWCFTGLVGWCAVIGICVTFNWATPTTASLWELAFGPLGHWLQNIMVGGQS